MPVRQCSAHSARSLSRSRRRRGRSLWWSSPLWTGGLALDGPNRARNRLRWWNPTSVATAAPSIMVCKNSSRAFKMNTLNKQGCQTRCLIGNVCSWAGENSVLSCCFFSHLLTTTITNYYTIYCEHQLQICAANLATPEVLGLGWMKVFIYAQRPEQLSNPQSEGQFLGSRPQMVTFYAEREENIQTKCTRLMFWCILGNNDNFIPL